MKLRLAIRSPDGANERFLETGFSDLDKLLLAGDGNCVEAEFNAHASLLDLKPRDIVTAQAFLEGVWRNLFAGVAVKPGALRAPGLSQIRLVGLKKRLYETAVPGAFYPGDDLGNVVRFVMLGVAGTHRGRSFDWPHARPDGVSAHTGDIPLVGFEVGDLEPNLKSCGEVFDTLAGMAPAFTVPAGASYTYNGETYFEGEEVPAVTWGVDPGRKFFFRRPPKGSLLEISETTSGVVIQWREVDAEELVTEPTVVLGRSSELGLVESLKRGYESLKSHTYPGDVRRGRAYKLIPVESGTTFLEPIAAGWTLANGTLVSGDLGTLSDPESTAKVRLKANALGVIQLLNDRPLPLPVDGFVLTKEDGVKAAWGYLFGGAGGLTFGNATGAELNGLVYADVTPPGAETSASTFAFTFKLEPDAEADFTDAYLVRLRRDLLNELARSYLKLPAENPAVVRLPELLTPSPRAALTFRDDSVLAAPVERLELKATKGRGAETLLHLGQKGDADALAVEALQRSRAEHVDVKTLGVMSAQYVSEYRRPGTFAPPSQPGNTYPPTDLVTALPPAGGEAEPYAHYRWTFTARQASNAQDAIQIQQVKLFTAAGEDVVQTVGASASASKESGTGPASNVLTAANVWSVNSGAYPVTLSVNTNQPTRITHYEFLYTSPGLLPGTWSLEGSLDGASWTLLDTVTNFAYQPNRTLHYLDTTPAPAVTKEAGARFFRFFVTAGHSSSYVGAKEIELRASQGGADVTAGAIVFASSGTSGTKAAPKAFDDSATTTWLSKPSPSFPEFIGVELAAVTPLAQYTLASAGVAASWSFKSWVLQGSNDGLSWTDLHTVDSAPTWSDADVRTFTL